MNSSKPQKRIFFKRKSFATGFTHGLNKHNYIKDKGKIIWKLFFLRIAKGNSMEQQRNKFFKFFVGFLDFHESGLFEKKNCGSF
jgi:hypothetical protein